MPFFCQQGKLIDRQRQRWKLTFNWYANTLCWKSTLNWYGIKLKLNWSIINWHSIVDEVNWLDIDWYIYDWTENIDWLLIDMLFSMLSISNE